MVKYAKISPKNGEPQRYSWGTQKKKNSLPLSLRKTLFFNFQKEAKNSSVRKASQLMFASVFFCVCRSVGVCVWVWVCDMLFVGIAAGLVYMML